MKGKRYNLPRWVRKVECRGVEHLLSVENEYQGEEVLNMTEQNDMVNHPAHYCDGGIETLDFILAKRLDFLTGQVCKYISRAGKKDKDKELEDLQKARFYLDRKITELEKGRA